MARQLSLKVRIFRFELFFAGTGFRPSLRGTGADFRQWGGVNLGQTVFSQLVDHLPRYEFLKCVLRYRGDYQQKSFSCWDQFLPMAFAELTYRESLRDIEASLRSMSGKLYHKEFRSRVARSTLAEANESSNAAMRL